MTSKSELKPCPFCGSNNVEYVRGKNWVYGFVNCWDCNAMGPEAKKEKEAASLWNTRA